MVMGKLGLKDVNILFNATFEKLTCTILKTDKVKS